MTTEQSPAWRFLAGLSANDRDALAACTAEDAFLRVWGPVAREGHGPRARLVDRLCGELDGLPEPAIIERRVFESGDEAAIEFTLHSTAGLVFTASERTALLRIRDGLVREIDLYVAGFERTGARPGWVAPAGMSDEDIMLVLESMAWGWDSRRNPPVGQSHSIGRPISWWGTQDAHPAANTIDSMRATEADADALIAGVIADYGARGLGFSWRVSPRDTPRDIAERLERHGLVYAGDQELMARSGLDAQDVPFNPAVEVRAIAADDDEAIETGLQITAACFQWTPEIVASERPAWFHENKNPVSRAESEHFLAFIDGKPAGEANLYFRNGLAYLGGAGVLPEFRSQKVYSTLLRHRLMAAHARGYNLAAIYAEPMSRRVVRRYGFKTYARSLVYGWMPEIDMDVIRTIVQDQ